VLEELSLSSCDVAICYGDDYNRGSITAYMPFDDCIIVHINSANFAAYLFVTLLRDLSVHATKYITLVRYHETS